MAEIRKVLIIDDDEIVLLAMADLMEDAGFKVITRNSPIGVTRVIADEDVDVVVIDINMPVMQGDSVIRLLRSWDKFREVPVVIVSGIANNELAEVKARVGDVPVVHKKSLQTELVPVVSGCIVARGTGTTNMRGPSDANRVVEKFLGELSTGMEEIRRLWSDLVAGRSKERRSLQQEAKRLLSRAQLVGLSEIARVLSALDATFGTFSGTPTPALTHAVQLSLRALEDAGRKEGKIPVSVQSLVDGLQRAADA